MAPIVRHSRFPGFQHEAVAIFDPKGDIIAVHDPHTAGGDFQRAGHAGVYGLIEWVQGLTISIREDQEALHREQLPDEQKAEFDKRHGHRNCNGMEAWRR